MTRGQRLAAAFALGAAVLLVGRAAALVYSDQEWFNTMGAASVWRARVVTTAVMYVGAFAIGVLFAWTNVSAVRRSVVALILPKRVGNVEFGEQFPSSRLRLVTAAVSVAASLISLVALPSWSTIALWRSGVVFAETDPYFNLDLSHFVAWLPVEASAYVWCVTLFAIVSAIVVSLYALTPSLSWVGRRFRIAGYARRHLSVLGVILVLLAAWGFRLDAFNTLVSGSGVDGAFTRTDHIWLIPADVSMSLITVGAAVVLLAAGWMGQLATAFATVTLVVAGTVVTQLGIPLYSRLMTDAPGAAALEQPYSETRDAYTARAFPREPVTPSVRYAAAPQLLANAGRLEVRGAAPDVVFPGARGAVLVPDPTRRIVAPRLGIGLTRLMHAWAEQNPRLMGGEFDANAALVLERDVRTRVHELAPVFDQSRAVGAVPTANGVLWIVDLYATSQTYPLSAPPAGAVARVTYRHHAGTAYVSGGTGATFIVPDSAPDPIARAWFEKHRGHYLVASLPPFVTLPPAVPARPANAQGDSLGIFRASVTRIYTRMRMALDSGDLRAFGVAFDSLGLVIAGRR